MDLPHHYCVDLMLGAVLSYIIFQYTRYTLLPVVDTDLFCRWSYGSIERFNVAKNDPLNTDPNDVENVPLTTMTFSTPSPPSELSDGDDVVASRSASPYIFDRTTSSATSNTSLDLQGDATPRAVKPRFD